MIRIVADTREQCPYTFRGYQATVTPGTLPAGDYSLYGFTDLVSVERKELGDLMGCLTHDRDRFTRELDRLRGYQAAALVIEASLATIRAGAYRSRMQPEAAVQSLFSIMEHYRLPVFFADNRTEGEGFCYDFLRHYHRHAAQRYKALGLDVPANKGGTDE